MKLNPLLWQELPTDMHTVTHLRTKYLDGKEFFLEIVSCLFGDMRLVHGLCPLSGEIADRLTVYLEESPDDE